MLESPPPQTKKKKEKEHGEKEQQGNFFGGGGPLLYPKSKHTVIQKLVVSNKFISFFLPVQSKLQIQCAWNFQVW